jgi:hypothetical protein
MWHTRVKEKISRQLGPNWRAAELAARAGLSQAEMSQALQCTGSKGCIARHGQRIQDAVAGALGISTSELFGPHAWFRLAAAKLQARIKERKAS